MIYQFDHRYGTYDGQSEAQAAQGILPRPSERDKSQRTYSVRTRYWVQTSDVEVALDNRPERGWYLAWRNITSAVSERTVISSVLPRVAVNHSMPLMFSEAVEFPFLVANLTSFALDWAARQKLGGLNLTFFVVRQLPVLPPSAYHASPQWAERPFGDWLRPYVAELAYTSDDLVALANATWLVRSAIRLVR